MVEYAYVKVSNPGGNLKTETMEERMKEYIEDGYRVIETIEMKGYTTHFVLEKE